MNIHLHANATITPKTRHSIQASTQSVTQLANELGVSEDTIRRWKRRDGVADGSHTPHRLPTTLTPAREVVVVALRKPPRGCQSQGPAAQGGRPQDAGEDIQGV